MAMVLYPIRVFFLTTALGAIFLLAPNPLAAAKNKAAAEAAGAALFRDKGCAYCHGLAAQGAGKGPALDEARKKWKESAVLDQILNGGQKMPAFRDALTDEEANQLVAWIRAKNRPAPPPLPAPPAQPASNPD